LAGAAPLEGWQQWISVRRYCSGVDGLG